MGQQQLLLIVLSVIIVGIAVVVGINMFGASAASANLDAVTNDLLHYASRAQQYYVKPTSMGGGGNSFADLASDADLPSLLGVQLSNDNGTYSIAAAGDNNSVKIQGVGLYDGDGDGTDVTITIEVFEDSLATVVVSR
jgi:Tfp pilus assembly protein PilE